MYEERKRWEVVKFRQAVRGPSTCVREDSELASAEAKSTLTRRTSSKSMRLPSLWSEKRATFRLRWTINFQNHRQGIHSVLGEMMFVPHSSQVALSQSTTALILGIRSVIDGSQVVEYFQVSILTEAVIPGGLWSYYIYIRVGEVLGTSSRQFTMGKGRKHVKQDILQGCPQPGDGQLLMRVLALRGSNQIEVEDSQGRRTLCLLPAKFHKTLWVKRGTFVIVDEGDREKAQAAGMKVTGTISKVLYEEHRRALEKIGEWPAGFASEPEDPKPGPSSEPAAQGSKEMATYPDSSAGGDEESDEDKDLPPLELNNNRLQPFNQYVCSDSDTDSDT